jgi:hypothetical protein
MTCPYGVFGNHTLAAMTLVKWLRLRRCFAVRIRLARRLHSWLRDRLLGGR